MLFEACASKRDVEYWLVRARCDSLCGEAVGRRAEDETRCAERDTARRVDDLRAGAPRSMWDGANSLCSGVSSISERRQG